MAEGEEGGRSSFVKLDHMLLSIWTVTWLQTQVLTTFPKLSRGLATLGSHVFSLRLGRRWAEKQSQTSSAHQSGKESPYSWTKGTGSRLPTGQGLVISLASCLLSWSTWNSSFPSFCSLFLLWCLCFSSGRFSFLSSFIPSSFHFPCLPHLSSLFLYPTCLPLSRQNLKPSGNKLENECMPFFGSSCPLGTLTRIYHVSVSPFLGLTPPLSMAFHWKHVGEWVLTEKSSGQFIPMGSKF